ncbi:hypothetical protein GALMADRAFT_216873 [Galerina marginata CBS 339.88]|uniref:Uncharacterized protein n=1 Tax=Galerina marginata (strain CBS 339.88) TaxID=685588 RepID=A0A067S9N0_GALM3|nr:hypothetical protein GALMADRAFT_216873 [Galerina marginata CBS 339.88]
MVVSINRRLTLGIGLENFWTWSLSRNSISLHFRNSGLEFVVHPSNIAATKYCLILCWAPPCRTILDWENVVVAFTSIGSCSRPLTLPLGTAISGPRGSNSKLPALLSALAPHALGNDDGEILRGHPVEDVGGDPRRIGQIPGFPNHLRCRCLEEEEDGREDEEMDSRSELVKRDRRGMKTAARWRDEPDLPHPALLFAKDAHTTWVASSRQHMYRGWDANPCTTSEQGTLGIAFHPF